VDLLGEVEGLLVGGHRLVYVAGQLVHCAQFVECPDFAAAVVDVPIEYECLLQRFGGTGEVSGSAQGAAEEEQRGGLPDPVVEFVVQVECCVQAAGRLGVVAGSCEGPAQVVEGEGLSRPAAELPLDVQREVE
jgi:hypothetical protein